MRSTGMLKHKHERSSTWQAARQARRKGGGRQLCKDTSKLQERAHAHVGVAAAAPHLQQEAGVLALTQQRRHASNAGQQRAAHLQSVNHVRAACKRIDAHHPLKDAPNLAPALLRRPRLPAGLQRCI